MSSRPSPVAPHRSSLHDRFLEALRLHRPKALEAIEEQRQAKRQKLEQQVKLAALFKQPAAAASCQEESAAKQKGATDSGSNGGSAPAGGGGGFAFSFAFGGS
jgi:hypothetical protein